MKCLSLPASRTLGGALCVLLLAACGTDAPLAPEQSAPASFSLQEGTIRPLDPGDLANRREFLLYETGDSPEIHEEILARGAGVVSGKITISGLGVAEAAQVDGEIVQVTGMDVEMGLSRRAAFVSNLAGEAAKGALQIVDIDAEGAMSMRAEMLAHDSEYNCVDLAGDRLAAGGNDALGNALVDLFDITNPEQPMLISRTLLAARTVLALGLEGDQLFVLSGDNGGLHRLDLTDPQLPMEAAFLPVADARDFLSQDGMVYLLHGSGMMILSEMELVAAHDIPGIPAQAPARAVISKGYFLTSTTSGVWAIDLLRDQSGLILESSPGTPNGIAIEGEALYRANGEAGLEVVHARLRLRENGDLQSGAKLRVLGDLDMTNAGSSNSAMAAEGLVFSGDGRGGILVCRTESKAFGN